MSEKLSTELKTYESELQALLQHQGKFVLIRGANIEGIYDSYDDALKAAYEKFGVADFMVKKIAPPEQVQFFSRDLGSPCHT